MSEINMTNQNRCDFSRDFWRDPNWYIESHRIILFRLQVNRRNVFSVQLLLRVILFRRGMFSRGFWLSYLKGEEIEQKNYIQFAFHCNYFQ